MRTLTSGKSILDVSNRAEITKAADVDLSRDEDSVQSLGSLGTKDGLIIFAGINSSAKDQEANNNQHLRSFDVKYPPRKKQKTDKSDEAGKSQWKLLGKRSLFKAPTTAKKETYQRILRLSPSQKRESGSKRIGAIATGLAKNSEIIVFNATNPTPGDADILTRIELDERQEAADLDIAEPEESQFSVAYCTDDGIHEQTFKYDFKTRKTEKLPKGPRRVYQMPFPDAMEDPRSRMKPRCIRFLNSQNVVVLCNRPNKTGAELRIFHFYPTGPAIPIQDKKLPSHIKQAVSMDVCALDSDEQGNQQFVVAVAGSDISIEVFTTNYQAQTNTFSSFKSYISLKDVHQHQMTKICFSPFHSPERSAPHEHKNVTIQGSAQVTFRDTGAPPNSQYIRLASVSYGNTVVVDTFPLQPLDPNERRSRYVLSHPSDEVWAKYTYIFVGSIIVLVVAFLLQSFMTGFSDEGKGSGRGPYSLLPKHVREFLDQPVAAAYGPISRVSEVVPSAVSTNIPSKDSSERDNKEKGRLQSLRDRHDIPHPDAESEAEKEKTLIIRAAPQRLGGVTVDVHPDKEAYREKDENAKHWEELEEHQKVRWRDRLKQAGQWAEGEGEKVLMGILFSEYAGVVGEVVVGAAEAMAEGLREL